MATLASHIRDYYWEHFSELPESTRFHFANRLALWEDDPQGHAYLEKIRSSYAPESKTALHAKLQSCFVEAPRTTMPAYERRHPFFEQYPQLYGLHQALFYVRHLDVLYAVDATPILAQLITPAEVEAMLRKIRNDPEALRVLSTIAVNTVYLAQRYCLAQPDTTDPSQFFALRNTYDTTDPDELRLLVYLLTHCIIADSNFYAQPLSTAYRPTYIAMLTYLEALIGEHFTELSLDTKLEFLVCCAIAHHQSEIQSRIHAECEASLSSEGTYLVDTQNHYASLRLKRGLVESEHRNVLYILSKAPFTKRA